jgi:hypothetical protein
MVLWQLSQEAVVRMCPAGCALAIAPLWQVLHEPLVTFWWRNRDGFHATEL